ncbi:hypothetical protein SASPL_156558 [Salvia splendens]|uniref:ABC transporter domain-containing protein n=1 Tax=Salvia splendens TaxID=180675 RepID=A0A8X8YWY3_SALSN|nr:hypothetical protein SASPL_156558 [Salvia splendens]
MSNFLQISLNCHPHRRSSTRRPRRYRIPILRSQLGSINQNYNGGNKILTGASSISSGVRLENVSKSYKGVTVLKDINWEVKRLEKVGLVGVNGAGKTTQLRIISGLEEPDSGTVIKAKENMKVAFLSQEFEVLGSRTVREEFLSAFEEEMEVFGKLEKVQKALERSVDDMELMGRLLDEFDLLQCRAQAVDLDEVHVKISKLMPALGFAPEDADKHLGSFSGGWQMRMSLGKILLQWLEGYLKRQDVPMVIISHDRAFLDQLCTKIVETDMGVSRTYMGNYSDYVIAKAAWVEAQFSAWEKQLKEIGHTRELINWLSAGANAGRASTAEKVLFKNANLTVERGEKLAILGPNGCGKSTLLKLIMGMVKPDRGAEALDLDKTVIETVAEIAEDWRLDDIKGLLGRCNFKADMLDRKVSFLSGGEKVYIHFSVLDEPTNHLDIPTKEMLEEAINEYRGTVITVSHDRYFIRQIVNRVLEIKDGMIQDYAGDYNYYLEKNLEARERELEREAELEEKSPKANSKSKMTKAKREARKKQKMQAFQAAKQKSKGHKNAKRWK